MHRNPIWLTFLVLTSLFSFSYLGFASQAVYAYYRLDSSRTPLTFNAIVSKQNAESYYLTVKYSFVANGQTYQAVDNSLYTGFWNAEAARRKAESLLDEKPAVWFSASNPAISSLHKAFPYRLVLSASILLFLQIYLFCLGYYVAKRDKA